MSINLSSLIHMADKETSKELKKYGMLPPNIKEALSRKMEERAAKAAEDAADSIIELLETKDRKVRELVGKIRYYRSLIKECQAKLSEMEAAENYGNDSQNYLPLAKSVGAIPPGMPVSTSGIFDIPVKYMKK